ncbi:hypothetical protein CQA53_10710 [Helicobacter didelphidarum]|uniref:Uncharacterized protein n=1 Tax=Helicobacter didelphidarum TaxID=2040648 RepID=A0A3D8I657_9HELI|nr:hypothetical protein [Helicobacter didelphidarum]RDU60639.1 hypothetical protein CQA53_10710 [Helicobacter didelphidarum]
MSKLPFILCFICYIYAQDSTLQWQSVDCKESDNMLIKSYGFIPECMDKDCKMSLCQGGLQNAQKAYINSSNISYAYRQWYQQDRHIPQMPYNLPLINTNIALYKDIAITPHIRYIWKDSKRLIIEEESECSEVNGTYPIGRYIILQQIGDKILIMQFSNQIC